MNHAVPDIAFLHELADAADKQTLPRFRSRMNPARRQQAERGFPL